MQNVNFWGHLGRPNFLVQAPTPISRRATADLSPTRLLPLQRYPICTPRRENSILLILSSPHHPSP
jgi:hypothetical protein